ncbi:MAG: penicillin-binding transpeptidase domain-containing protein [Solirubrobacteraceae bacterium]
MTENKHQRLRRALPVLALALVAFLVGAIVGASRGSSPSLQLAERFASAWAHGDYAAMYGDISSEAQHGVSPQQFADAYRGALATATATAIAPAGGAHAASRGMVRLQMRVRTRLWGTLELPLTLRVESGEEGERIAWASSMSFPGLAPGATLSRRVSLPRRATLLARDGSVLAESPAGAESQRSTPLGEYASAVVGQVGPLPSARRQSLEAEGVPPDAQVGVSGLELAFDGRLRGTPGGELLAGGRVLAYAAPRPAATVRTTISPAVQRSAVTALGGQLGGIVAMQPSTGQVLAVAGLGLDGLQPPGSTFKIVTLSGALEAHVATPHTVFPYATHATLDGVRLNNANGEECGGTLELAFAVSCNSVFTPLGVKLGAHRLVATAEAFGFNHPSGLPGAPASTLPAAPAIQGELAVGSTAIGQGQVLATPLQMLVAAATIADGGQRPAPTFDSQAATPQPQRAVSAGVARSVRHLMTEVVRAGTGTRAAIPEVTVAGKTGTAELKSACPSSSEQATSSEPSTEHEGCKQGSEANSANTDAWFTAFAPEIHPRIAVCVMLVKDGAGGETAAPVAREVLVTGLHGY